MSETGGIQTYHGQLPDNISFGHPPSVPGRRPGPENKLDDEHEQRAATTTIPVTPQTPPLTVSEPINAQIIAIINESTVLTTEQVETAVSAIQIQLDRDFSLVWGKSAHLEIIKQRSDLAADSWLMAILDDSDQADALGYHDLTAAGQPIGKVFVKTDIDNDLSWTVTLSHEILEILVDPDVNYTVFNQTKVNSGNLYAMEVCDAVESDSDGYEIDNVLVSDFIYPSWFDTWRQPHSVKFDHTGKLNKPLEIAPDGYTSIFPIPNHHGWVQAYSRNFSKRLELKLKRNSRTVRRMQGGPNKIAMQEQINAIDINQLLDYCATLKPTAEHNTN